MHRLLSLLLCIAAVLYGTRVHGAAEADTSYAGYMQQCDDYIRHYQPEASFAHVPDSLNGWLIARALAHDHAPLKYACALLLLQNQKLISVTQADRSISDGMLPERNGFVILLREAMGRGQVSDSISDAEYLPFSTADICYWIRHNKKKIPDYEYLTPFLQGR